MELVMAAIEFLKVVYANIAPLAAAVSVLCTVLVAIFLPIKGEQPEKFLNSCIAFLAKFSKK